MQPAAIPTLYADTRFRPAGSRHYIAQMSGRTFGLLAVKAYSRFERCAWGVRDAVLHYWTCVCICGRTKDVASRDLLRGHTVSCGCQANTGLVGGGSNRKPHGEAAFNLLLGSYKRSSQLRGHSFQLTTAEFRALVQMKCHYCGDPPSQTRRAKGINGSFVYSGIDRVDNSKGYQAGNVVACCRHCNTAKGTRSSKDFLCWAARVAQIGGAT